jgi:Tol biopolymer transport system component
MIDDRRFEQQLPEALAGLAATSYPPYIDDVLAITARTSRRPAWRFPSRWLPFSIARPGVGLRTRQLRPVFVLVLVLLLLAALVAVYFGSPHVPQPFGPARNGEIIFSADHAAYVVEEDGTSRLLIDVPGDDLGLTYSLDGTRIAFVQVLDYMEYLWVANADGTEPIQLVDQHLDSPGNLAWSPDGRQIAIGPRVGGANRIMIVEADGSGSTILKLPFPARDPVWRPPDGRELAVRGSFRGRTQLFVVASDGSSYRPIGPPGAGLFIENVWEHQGAAWSPDGTRLAYNSIDAAAGAVGYEAGPDHADDLRFLVHMIQPDGTDVVLDGGPDIDVMESWPSWSPDGSLIAIERWRFAGDSWLAILPADGSGPGLDIMLTTPFEPAKGWAYTWSPDGTRLLAFYDAETKAASIDVATGAYQEVEWPLTERPAWQRLTP